MHAPEPVGAHETGPLPGLVHDLPVRSRRDGVTGAGRPDRRDSGGGMPPDSRGRIGRDPRGEAPPVPDPACPARAGAGWPATIHPVTAHTASAGTMLFAALFATVTISPRSASPRPAGGSGPVVLTRSSDLITECLHLG
ncbi:hypothetical protein GCM10027612_84540 [Microbispora bryophytorum subsp. camponoti]